MSIYIDLYMIIDSVSIEPGLSAFNVKPVDKEWSSAGAELYDKMILYIEKNYKPKINNDE